MALQTDLNVFPYYDDYDPTKNFYRILFKPGVAVQARELNQLQTILQNQVEKFGDNIFKRGTIIEGCNIIRHPILPYVKIKDTETDGTQIAVTAYEGMSVRNTANLTGYIVKTVAGFESRAPDLNTLYIKYNSSGTNSNTATYAAGETLTVFSQQYPIFKTLVNNGSSTISNNDSVVIVSALAVQNTTGGNSFPTNAFVTGQIIQNGVANLEIVSTDATTNTQVLVLKVKPLAADLITANTIKWRVSAGDSVRNATTANIASVVAVIGSGASGSLVTDGLGKVTSISVTSGGTGYYVPPHVTVMKQTTSSLTAVEIGVLDVTALNYMATISVANSILIPVGTGYGVTVDEGTIYQKGFFSRVSPQLTVVSKYSNTDFNKSVGFFTAEDIIDSNEDTSLLDNATGTYNYAAPGADRLKLTPELIVLDKDVADANTDFLPIIEFADGRPYKQNQSTVYNVIGDEMAKRTYEESGNYVLDQFIVSTRDSTTFSETASVFKMNIDPGKAYINGYRVETDQYRTSVAKGVATATNTNAKIRLGFGNYVRVNQLAGNFAFNIGGLVELHSSAATYITTSAAAGSAITTPGAKIGEARMRSLALESGEPGTANAVYRLYLFDVVMNSGQNFGAVRSVFYDGSNDGIADVVLSDAGTAILEDSAGSSLLFNSVPAMKAASNISYTYRTTNEGEIANTSGYITLELGSNIVFPYTGVLSTSAERDLLVIPKENYQASTPITGTVSIGAGSVSNTIVAATGAGANLYATFTAGDFVRFANSINGTVVIKQIAQVTSNTTMVLTSGAGQTYTGGSATLYYPKNVPISLTSKSTRWANVNTSNSQIMTIYLGNNISNTGNSSSDANVMVTYNATRIGVSSELKTAERFVYTRVRVSDNAGSVRGPWALGVSDAFRLRKVYQANGASVAKTFNANTGVVSSFISLPNNVFANGDAVVYSNTGMTSGITGLTNGATYYAVFANTLGTALASTRGGANLSLTASATSENHTLTGQPLFFTGDTYGVSDITNDFYIDTNQKEDYLDTSYLYRKPRVTTLGTDDVLLIQYDAFTGGSASVKTINSYRITDTLDFAALSAQANVHTMEIPEILGTSGTYYDLRDQYDFRPRSANTIALIKDISTVGAAANALSIINPTEPSSANRFDGSEKYFPAPDTDLTASIEYYLGRSDRVVVDSNGEFLVRTGKNGFINDIPPEPKNSLTLQILNIPPYPSLSQAMSNDMAKIIDTKVANETYSKRIKTYTITSQIGIQDRARIQVKGYKMTDIASLEKRIKDLEYYVSFTLAEALAKARFIPSSADSLTDRFRFGFFVDPFTDYNYADVGNPEFYATIRDDQLGPRLTELNLEFRPDDGSTGVVTLPYNEFTIVTQNDATDGSVEGPVSVTTVSQTTATAIQSERSTSNSDSGLVYEEFFYTLSSLTGPVEFYITGRDNNMAVEVFQSETPGGTFTTTYTSASALAITSTDITTKGLSILNGGRKIEHPGSLERKSNGPVGGFIEDQFKMLWTHNPNDGVYYKIRVYKGRKSGGFLQSSKAGTFGFKLYYPSDVVSTQTRVVPNPANFGYTGIVHQITPPDFTIMLSKQYSYMLYGSFDLGEFVSDAQKFNISITGLKPNTYHKFVFDGEDKTTKCSQSRTSTTNTSGLLADANGILNFDFYYDAGIDEATSDLQQRNKLAAATAGTKIFSVESYDGNSKSSGAIGLKYYTNIPFDYNNASGLNTTQTATMASTSTDRPSSSQADMYTAQAVNDAIDRKNVRIVNYRDINGREQED
jgi:hypothetical protein